jgi:hypothetical protein
MFKDLDKNLIAGILGLMSVFVFSVALNQYMTLKADFSSAPGADMAAVVATAPAPVTIALNSCETVEYLYSLGYISAENIQKSRNAFNCSANTAEIKVLGVKDSLVAVGTASMLVGDFTLSIKTNSSVADVQSLVFGKNLPWRLVKSTASTTPIYVNGMTMSVYSVSGVKNSNSIPKAGTYTVVFRVGFPANNLFAGSYRYEYNPQGSAVTPTNKVILGNYITVTGEKGPYIKTAVVKPTATGYNVVFTGERIVSLGVGHDCYTTSGRLVAGGVVPVPNSAIAVAKDGSSLTFSILGVTEPVSYCRMDVSNTFGSSNRVYVDFYGVKVYGETKPLFTVLSPNGGEKFIVGQNISGSFTTSLPVGTDFEVALVRLKQAPYTSDIVWSLGYVVAADRQTFTLKIPENTTPGTNYVVRVWTNDGLRNESEIDFSDKPFTIISSSTTPSIKVTSPNGGELLKAGEGYIVKWWDSSDAGNKNITIINLAYPEIVIPITLNSFMRSSGVDGTYAYVWDIGASVTAGNYKIKICQSDTNVCDTSDNYFTITSSPTNPSIKVTSPNGGETWTIDSPVKVTWSANVSATTTDVFLVKENGSSCLVGTAMPGMSEYGFRLSGGAGNDCNFTTGRYKAYVKAGGVADYGDNYFSVTSTQAANGYIGIPTKASTSPAPQYLLANTGLDIPIVKYNFVATTSPAKILELGFKVGGYSTVVKGLSPLTEVFIMNDVSANPAHIPVINNTVRIANTNLDIFQGYGGKDVMIGAKLTNITNDSESSYPFTLDLNYYKYQTENGAVVEVNLNTPVSSNVMTPVSVFPVVSSVQDAQVSSEIASVYVSESVVSQLIDALLGR